MAQAETAVRTIKNYIGGGWVDAEASESLDVTNPASGETMAQLPMSSQADLDRAVEAAREAFPAWRATSPVERARACFRLKNALEERGTSSPRSSPATTARRSRTRAGEVRRGIECVEVATGIPSLMQGSNLEDVSRGIDSDMIRQPIGVFAAITPFNFPFMVPLWFLPFAIACGEHVHPQAVGAGSARRRAALRAARPSRDPGRRGQPRERRQGRGQRDPRAPGDRRRLVRRLDPGRAARLRDGGQARQARPGARRREEPRRRHARRGDRIGRRRRALLGLPRAGQRCLANSVVRRGRRRLRAAEEAPASRRATP